MDLNDSFTETLLQRSKARKEYLKAKMNVTSNTDSKKRSVLENYPKESSKKQRLNCDVEDEKENLHIGTVNVQDTFVPSKVSSNVKGLATMKKKDASGAIDDDQIPNDSSHASNKCEIYISSIGSSHPTSAHQSRPSNLASKINQWENQQASNKTTSLSTKTNTSSVCSLPTSKSNSVAIKLYYTNTPSKSRTMGIQTVSKLGKVKDVSDSELGSSCMQLVTETSNNGNVREPGLKTKTALQDLVVNGVDNKQSGKFLAKPLTVSTKESSNNNEGPTPISLSTRKAFFEKASAGQHSIPIKTTSPPKLSVAQRAAMFENATNNEKKSQGNLSLPKKIAQPAIIKGFEDEQRLLDVPCRKRMNLSDVKSSGLPVYKGMNQAVPELPTCEDNTPYTSYKEHQFTTSSITCSKHRLNDNREEATNTEQVVKPAFHQMHEGTNAVKSVDRNNTYTQYQSVENFTINTQQAESVPKVSQGKEISTLVNHWEKLASSTGFGNNICEDSPTVQSEKTNTNADMSEGEHSDCKSEMEWGSTDGESTSEWEYTKGESISESPHKERHFIPDCNEEVTKDALESKKDSIMENINEETMNSSSTTSIEKESMDSMTTHSVPLPGLTRSGEVNVKVQNWQQKVNEITQSTDNTSFETSSYDANSLNPKTPLKQIHSSTVSTKSNETQDSTESSVEVSSSNFGSPLVHTVSFYRKQKLGSKLSSPMKPVKRPLSPTEDNGTTQRIQGQIKLLQEEVLRQQTVIGQTSQALNLCYATTEFSGSSEKIEAERLLLIATQKRLACMNEIQCIKSQGAQGEMVAEGTGTLTITDIQLPLKQDFIASLMKGEISRVHCFLCLIRHGAQVIVTQMASTSDRIMNGALTFYNHVELQHLSSDFSVAFEVYTLQTHKENLPHDKKYHIKREHSKIRLTPKGKKIESRLLYPAISSPGGPDAVRTSNFTLIGYTTFTVQNSNKKCFTLDKVPFSSPLEGILKVNLHLQSKHTTSHKGFLTLFQDISNYGHWTRLWCSLHNQGLNYWKYPDDEQRKRPAGAIDLRQCVTDQVRAVSQDECARPNTFRVVTVREVEEGDRETLVQRKVDTMMTTKHLQQGLNYWKYPDDEQRKRPAGAIDLRQCVTGQVRAVSQDECARPNTFRVVTVREVEEGDRETLVQRKVDTLMTTKHLLSADTKEERIAWCHKINEALSNIRKWDAQALQPLEDK